MGKYTVKHYLNTKIKPLRKGDNLLYPIYVQIVYNKFSTDKRSVTEVLTTSEGFAEYLESRNLVMGETKLWYTPKDKDDLLIAIREDEYALKDEILKIESSLRLIDKIGLNVKRSNIFRAIDKLSKPVYRALLEQVRNDLDLFVHLGSEYECNYNTDYEQFLQHFSGHIVDSIMAIKEYTKIDLSSFIKEETLLTFKALDIIRDFEASMRISGNLWPSFAEFVLTDYSMAVKNTLYEDSIKYYESVVSKIESIVESYIRHIKIMNGIEE